MGRPITSISLLLLAAQLFAGTTGKITGRVRDQATGEPLVGVNVIVEESTLGAATDMDGHYFILNIPPGTYTVAALMIGYKKTRLQNVMVATDHTSQADFELVESTIMGEEVMITATRPMIKRDLTSTEASISAQQIADLPVLTLTDVLNLQAGVVDGHFRGGRSSEVTYLIDGVSINDVFTSEAALFVETNVIQELKVISGTFNAEYGQAQSGVVDIITKDGSDAFKGTAGIQLGDYVSGHKNIFENVDDINPTHYLDYTLFLSGPIGNRLRYLLSAERVEDDGFLYGRNNFLPTDEEIEGDGQYIPMGFSDRTSLFTKFSLALTPRDRTSLSVTFQQRDQNRDFGIYDHRFRYNPLGNSTSYEEGIVGIFGWNHIFSAKSYVNLRAAYNRKTIDRYLYADPLDPRYASDGRFRQTGNFAFHTGGTDMTYFQRMTTSQLIKGDFTSQVSAQYQIQLGGELRRHRLKFHDIVLKKNPETGNQVQIPPPNTADNQEYDRVPLEASAYFQSKWESNDFILNLGLRFDYFDASGVTIDSLVRPRTSSTSPSDPTYQASPRLGIAYPITDRGVMHVSYGHFFQIPQFEFLYANPSFTVNPEEGRGAVLNFPFGNANLQPQKTVGYEIGLQQQLSELMAIDVTVYYKDIRNLLGSELITIATGEQHAGITYGRFVNRDYGQVKGFTIAFERRMSNGFAANVDYTYQVARGNASDPKSVLIDNQSEPPVESEKQLVPLNWDRPHTLNIRLSAHPVSNVTVTLVGVMGVGFPYTPIANQLRASLENSARKPSFVTFDLFAQHTMRWGPLNVNLNLKALNIFDQLVERDVYADTGRATYTTDILRAGEAQGPNTKDEFFTRPDWYGPPRRVIIGISTTF